MILNIIALLFTTFVPGYFLTFAFFPKKSDIDRIERIGLSFAISVIFIPLLLFILNMIFGISINIMNSWAIVLFLIIAGIFISLIRNRREIEEKKLNGYEKFRFILFLFKP